MEEVIALFGEFGTSVLQAGAVIGLTITVILFILEVRWSRAIRPAAGGQRRRRHWAMW